MRQTFLCVILLAMHSSFFKPVHHEVIVQHFTLENLQRNALGGFSIDCFIDDSGRSAPDFLENVVSIFVTHFSRQMLLVVAELVEPSREVLDQSRWPIYRLPP